MPPDKDERRPGESGVPDVHGGNVAVIVPVDLIACPDCRATGCNLTHDATCPISRGLRAAQADDDRWFAARPYARRRVRPVTWAEVMYWRAAGVAGAYIVPLDRILRRVHISVEPVGAELRRGVHVPDAS